MSGALPDGEHVGHRVGRLPRYSHNPMQVAPGGMLSVQAERRFPQVTAIVHREPARSRAPKPASRKAAGARSWPA